MLVFVIWCCFDIAIYDKSFYPSKLLPQHQLGCDDPLETILSAADKYGIRFLSAMVSLVIGAIRYSSCKTKQSMH